MSDEKIGGSVDCPKCGQESYPTIHVFRVKDKIKWSALSARERDALVGEHVFELMEVDVVQQPEGTEGYRGSDLSGCWIVLRRSDGAYRGMNYPTRKEALDAYRADEYYFKHYTTCPKACAEVKAKLSWYAIEKYVHKPLFGCRVRIGPAAEDRKASATGSTEEEVICIAALRACGIEVEA